MSVRQGSKVIAGNAPISAGFIETFAGSVVPTGWLACDGSAISRTDYADFGKEHEHQCGQAGTGALCQPTYRSPGFEHFRRARKGAAYPRRSGAAKGFQCRDSSYVS